MNYRNLNNDELVILKKNGCLAENWDLVLVTNGFQPERVRNVYFSGRNCLGIFEGSIDLEEGETVACGVYNTTLHDTILEDDVFVASVQFLSRYHVQSGSIIRNVGTIAMSGSSAFGNGIEISVLNEAGGREVMIYDRLTSQIAYIMATARHDNKVHVTLRDMIGNYAEGRKSDRGTIASGAEIRDTGVIRNVLVGPGARISNARHLEEGTLASNSGAPIHIGAGVIARNFIIQSGSEVDSGAILNHCFVGQGVQIGKQFSAEHSAFFANCEGFHGEAVSIFAGPYSVTHHKSTLLIAAIMSFLNVGSGTNQSNHMYKLGPLHQGVLERGVKTGSFSYMAWPIHVGPFTAVIGKHSTQMDASVFPFSYINEVGGKSVLTPAMNLFTVGTRRDSDKWPARDRRKDPEKFDQIHFDLYNPYLMGKVVDAVAVMDRLRSEASREQEFVFHKGVHIKRLLLKTCAKYYEIALKIFFGRQLKKRLAPLLPKAGAEAVKKALRYDSDRASERWVDASGMLMPHHVYEGLLADIAAGKFRDLQDLEKTLQGIAGGYDDDAWAWCARLLEKRLGRSVEEWDAETIGEIIKAWEKEAVKGNNMICHDAAKEYDPSSRISYGIDADPDADFEAVRGKTEDDKFIKLLKNENEEIAAESKELLSLISVLK